MHEIRELCMTGCLNTYTKKLAAAFGPCVLVDDFMWGKYLGRITGVSRHTLFEIKAKVTISAVVEFPSQSAIESLGFTYPRAPHLEGTEIEFNLIQLRPYRDEIPAYKDSLEKARAIAVAEHEQTLEALKAIPEASYRETEYLNQALKQLRTFGVEQEDQEWTLKHTKTARKRK